MKHIAWRGSVSVGNRSEAGQRPALCPGPARPGQATLPHGAHPRTDGWVKGVTRREASAAIRVLAGRITT